jgi:hypothetical protein
MLESDLKKHDWRDLKLCLQLLKRNVDAYALKIQNKSVLSEEL